MGYDNPRTIRLPSKSYLASPFTEYGTVQDQRDQIVATSTINIIDGVGDQDKTSDA